MSKKCAVNPRLGAVGGQAVMEGVMMNSKQGLAIAVRNTDGDIVVRQKQRHTLREKYKICRVPVIRGIVGFAETLVMSFRTLTESTEMLGVEMEAESKFEKWLDKKFGKSIMAVASLIGTVLGVALALLLFIWLPALLVRGIEKYIVPLGWTKSVIEGLVKIGIFVAYIARVSLMPEIKRVFMYHGAEHKTIFCYENGLDLTVENVRKQKRFHPRCGTSFIFVIMILSILAGSVITWDTMWIRVLLKLVSLPLVVGVGYEYIMYAGKHENTLTRILSAPGLWLQHITTREPDDSMIEVGIASVKASLVKEFPDYDVPTEEKVAAAKKAKAEKEAEAESSGKDGGNSENN